ncbi:hypothetical protein PanWU01x14_185790 [Parasponia andersonii]|uniref:Uncharacterized protein n=1 Tax=Parasponia andersonii TaxID=3476 RepID=A0A2P5C3V4_PARAD|nr:hypothetical protein PanWU01x14_185790 [Parasponia andersonii]
MVIYPSHFHLFPLNPPDSLDGPSMFKVPEYQVADYKASQGTLGPLIYASRHFYKPIQSDDRGSNTSSPMSVPTSLALSSSHS